jgi:exodeoxyribonuclease III
MKIATFNVNSIRRRLPVVLDWLRQHEPDVLGLQETKVQDSDFPVDAIREAGYHVTFRGMKGYNGVATLTREQPEFVMHGLHEGPDNEDVRILQTVVAGIPIINTYVPQGYSIRSEKYTFKLRWLRELRHYFDKHLDPQKPAVWLGDLNVAPEPIDVYHPDRRVNDVDFHIDARNAYKETVAWGLIDVFRKLHPIEFSTPIGITSGTHSTITGAGGSTTSWRQRRWLTPASEQTSTWSHESNRAHRTIPLYGPNSTFTS